MAKKFAIKLAALSLLACAACSGIEREPSNAAAASMANVQSVPPSAARHSNAPFVVRLSGPENPASRMNARMTLVLVVERNLVDATPLRLSFQLPAGVTLVEGRLSEEIVDTASSRIERRIVIDVPSIPEDDVLVAVEARGTAWGARGEGAYRFGRPEPMLPQAPRARKPMTVKGGPDARPVMMPPPSGAR